MRYFLVLIFICLFSSFNIISQEINLGDYDVIIWSENIELKWSDFYNNDTTFKSDYEIQSLLICNNIKRKKVKLYDRAASYIAIFVYYTDDNDLSVVNIFVKNRSWKSEGYSRILLSHEQIHFDIAEYYSRLIRMYLEKTRFTNNLVERSFIDLLMGMYNNTQILFDLESEHGSNSKIQNTWQKDIHIKIKTLESYSKALHNLHDLRELLNIYDNTL